MKHSRDRPISKIEKIANCKNNDYNFNNELFNMKKNITKVLSIILAIITIFSTSAIGLTASAASNTSYSSYNAPENSGDYAYWNGSKVVKSSSTTKDEIRWIQAAINYCIAREGLNTSYIAVDGSFGPGSKTATIAFQKAAGLTADGSFGPASIQKMKSVLNDGKDNSLKSSKTSSNSKITTAQIQSVLNNYGYSTGKYWTYKSGGSSTSSYVATTRQGRQYSYSYNGVECYGFANFVMHKVTGTTVNPNNGNKNGWKYIKASDVSELKVGDIVRIGKSNSNGHSGIVLTVDGNGKCTFAQCFGGVNNKISIGTSLASSSFGSHSTLSSMKNAGVLLYVYRYVG
jgi:peptidoglycan hydrolase-like protein with peptidoglycan-binding domain